MLVANARSRKRNQWEMNTDHHTTANEYMIRGPDAADRAPAAGVGRCDPSPVVMTTLLAGVVVRSYPAVVGAIALDAGSA